MNSRTICILLCLVTLLSLCGCKNGRDVAKTQDTAAAIPDQYEEILSDYNKVLTFRLSDTFESDYNDGKNVTLSDSLMAGMTDELAYRWSCMLVEMTSGRNEPEKRDFGYVLKDINKDGKPELFWVRQDHTILAVFTIKNDQVRLVDAFWTRYEGVVTDTGALYTIGSSGAASSEYRIREMTSDGSEATIVKEFGIDDNQYYEITDGEKVTVSEERFEELLTIYPFEKNTDWEIVPMS